MTVRLFALLVVSQVVTLSGVARAAEPSRRPNIIVLLADDLGYGELGCQGNRQIPTPHIDSIAHEGVRFTSGYVTCSFCAPSRAGLMTGRYQTRFGFENNPVGKENNDPRVGLPASQRTLAQVLQGNGYATGLVGKWHLGGRDEFHPLERGFDEFFGFLHEGHFYVPTLDNVYSFLRKKTPPDGADRWIRADGRLILSNHLNTDEPPYDEGNPLLRGRTPVEEQSYLTEVLTREATAFIDRHHEQPFFLYVAYNAVHSPMQATLSATNRFTSIPDAQRRIFAGMLSALDESVGSILNAVREHDLDRQTLIFFFSDNGGPTRELTSSNLPLRGGKGDLYEGGIRVPFMMRWKGTVPEGQTIDDPVISLDVFPTALAAAGVRHEDAELNLDGMNLLPYVISSSGRNWPQRDLYWRMGSKTALRHGVWKLIGLPNETGGRKWELYQLKEDLSEANNLGDRWPHRLSDMQSLWKTWDDQMQSPAWQRVPRPR